jgi:hypothetical protein
MSHVEAWLHYVGRKTYRNCDYFEQEAKRLGVQRAVPFYMLKNFKWGERVLLATWLYDKENQRGSAEVFGYFTVDSIVQNLPKEVVDKLLQKLDVESVSSGESTFERRRCGDYSIRSTIFVRDSVEDLAEKAKEACRECGVDPNDFKWFLRGSYTPVESFLMTPARFTRSYIKVSFVSTEGDAEPTESKKSLVWIYDYRQRGYVKKSELTKFGSEVLTKYFKV